MYTGEHHSQDQPRPVFASICFAWAGMLDIVTCTEAFIFVNKTRMWQAYACELAQLCDIHYALSITCAPCPDI